MKKYIFLSLMLGAVNLFADENSRFLISGHTGFTKEYSPPYFSSYWERGLNMGAGLGMRVGKNFVLQISAEYHLFKNAKDFIAYNDGSVYTFLLYLKKRVPVRTKSSFIPYYKAGAGLLQLNTAKVFSKSSNEYTRETITELVEEKKHRSAFSAACGMGFDMVVNENTIMNLEITVVLGFDTKVITIVPLKLGVTVDL
ncbi:outer membrane beta-barrel protein [candidate division KSB1 bacterium]|nr:outer membrane beta-barrel protein [candidate division KSB1 bacterium]